MQPSFRPGARVQRPLTRERVRHGIRALAAASLGAIVLAVARPAFAQDASGAVTGKITAADGNQPLGGATIFITGTQSGALSRTDGTYRIALRPGRYEVRVRFIGWTGTHDSVTVAAGQTVAKDFALERSPTTLEALAVIGTRGEARTVTESPVPIDVLTSADIVAPGVPRRIRFFRMLAPSFNFPRPSMLTARIT